MKTKASSQLFQAALQQFLEDQDRRLAALIQAAAATEGVDLREGWRFDLQAREWRLIQPEPTDKPAA